MANPIDDAEVPLGNNPYERTALDAAMAMANRWRELCERATDAAAKLAIEITSLHQEIARLRQENDQLHDVAAMLEISHSRVNELEVQVASLKDLIVIRPF